MISGLRTTVNFGDQERPGYYRTGILLMYPNATAKNPLTALTALMKSEKTTDPMFHWFQKAFPSQRVQLSAAITATATTIPVTAGATQIRRGHVIRVLQTGELMYVTANPTSDTSFTVTRGFAGTTAAAVDPAAAGVNPFLRVLSTAMEEGSQAPVGINYTVARQFNYAQIFRNTFELTKTADKTELRTGDAYKEAKRECLELHSTEMEKAFIFGVRTETTFNGRPLRTTGGLVSFIPASNIVDAGTTTNMEQLEGWLERAFRFGSSEKIAFAGNSAMLVLQQIIRKNSSMQIVSGIKEYGMRVSRFISSFGELVMFTHPLFTNDPGGTTGGTPFFGWDSNILIVDQARIVYRYLRDTRFEENLEQNGEDSVKDGFITEAGLEVHFGESHFLIRGLRAAAKDP